MTTLRQLREDVRQFRESMEVQNSDEIKAHVAAHGATHSNPYTFDAKPKKMKQGGHTTTITRVKFERNPTDKEFGDAEHALKNKFGEDHRLHTMQPIKVTSHWGDFNDGVKHPSVGEKGGHKWTGD